MATECMPWTDFFLTIRSLIQPVETLMLSPDQLQFGDGSGNKLLTFTLIRSRLHSLVCYREWTEN